MAQPTERMNSYEAVEIGIISWIWRLTGKRFALFDCSVWFMENDCRAAKHTLNKVNCRSDLRGGGEVLLELECRR
jgi:hypothetical protein